MVYHVVDDVAGFGDPPALAAGRAHQPPGPRGLRLARGLPGRGRVAGGATSASSILVDPGLTLG